MMARGITVTSGMAMARVPVTPMAGMTVTVMGVVAAVMAETEHRHHNEAGQAERERETVWAHRFTRKIPPIAYCLVPSA